MDDLKDFLITDRKNHSFDVVVQAVNGLKALDAYSVAQGFVPYSDLPDLDDWIGRDEHGLFATMTNRTIWAIPAPAELVRPKEATLAQLVYEGLWVSLHRNTETGQLIVNINSEGCNVADQDLQHRPYIEVTLNGGTIHDYDQGQE